MAMTIKRCLVSELSSAPGSEEMVAEYAALGL